MLNAPTPVLVLFGLTIFCLLMVFLSAFTARTAIFASEKTKAKGALFWLFLVALCLLAAPAISKKSSATAEQVDNRLGDISEYERFEPALADEVRSEWEFHESK